MKLCVSLMHQGREIEYHQFPITLEGIERAEHLVRKRMATGWHYCLSTWQFDEPWNGDLANAKRAIKRRDVEALKKLLNRE